jgi:hypothetical protein
LNIFDKHKLKHRSLTYKIFHFIGKFLLTLFVIVLIAIGFSQTVAFRNLLREQIISFSKEKTIGKLSIGKIEGSLFTNLAIDDVRYEIDGNNLI